ncbi:MAG: tRNA pseudouridine(13) synthase TruD [Candidatus Thermoplasmatota archaeon]|nr:tRNA pseudouridine(13) synthase TruD [Candidatus Thermoplasmatota archaeon]
MDFSNIGVNGFYFDLNPSGGKLRKESEDFYVEELFDHLEKQDEGKVLVLKLRAKNWEHNRLIRFVARSFHVSPKRVYFAGTKDRRSVKVQYFSIPGVVYRDFSLDDVDVLEHFYLDSPLTIGSHSGNWFDIRVSDAEPDTFLSNCNMVKTSGIVPNFYGPQRFGSIRPVTHLVGREIVRGNFREAVRMFVGYPGEDRFAEVRKEYFDNPDPVKGLQNFPESLDLERKVMEHLTNNADDFSGAIKQLPENLVSMFVHAYQGYIFNRILSRRFEISKSIMVGDVYNLKDDTIRVNNLNHEKLKSAFDRGEGSPTALVIGYGTEYAGGKPGEIEREIIDEEGVKQIDFKLPFGLSSRGERRDIFLRFSDMECTESSARFKLPPGGYATSVLREILRVSDMANY